VTIYKVITH